MPDDNVMFRWVIIFTLAAVIYLIKFESAEGPKEIYLQHFNFFTSALLFRVIAVKIFCGWGERKIDQNQLTAQPAQGSTS